MTNDEANLGADIFAEFASGSLEQHIAAKDLSWEQTAVKRVLAQLGLSSAPALRQIEQSRTGRNILTFAAFDELYPSFPHRFCARRVYGVFEVAVGDVSKHFTKTALYKEWEKCQDETPDYVMVVPWHGYGTAVVHQEVPDFKEPGFFVARVFANSRCVIEDLARFLAPTKQIWSASPG
jgi:hypothetical protein